MCVTADKIYIKINPLLTLVPNKEDSIVSILSSFIVHPSMIGGGSYTTRIITYFRIMILFFYFALFSQYSHCVEDSEDHYSYVAENCFPHSGYSECSENKEQHLDGESKNYILLYYSSRCS